MSEILEKSDKRAKRSHFFKSFLNHAIIFLFVISLGIYFGNMMFGKRSLDVMLGLKNKKEQLSQDVKLLKERNAQLQKKYFELKELEVQINKK